jgi:hypothetical protein
MVLNVNNSVPYMKSLATCLHRIVTDGYNEDFSITEKGLEAMNQKTVYTPEQIQVVNFFRFEGPSDPADNAILYVIETSDGAKGTLVDGYGAYHNALISRFMKNVEDIHKKPA